MNKIINTFLLTGDKFMPELHLKQPGFTYSACEPFTKYCERIQRFRETGNVKHLYRNELDKACCNHDAAYSDSNDLVKRTISDKTLKDRAYKSARNCNYDGYQRALASMVNKIFDKKAGLGISVNEQLAKELHKPVIKKEENSVQDLRTIFGQQIQLKCDRCLQEIKMLNIYYVSQMFSLNMHGLNL